MKRIVIDVLSDVLIMAGLFFFVWCVWAVTGELVSQAKAESSADLPDWYNACQPDQNNFAAWAKCVTDQMPEHKPCEGVQTAAEFYECAGALHPPLAPDGEAWQTHFYARDLNARLQKSISDACIACLKQRNRRGCRC